MLFFFNDTPTTEIYTLPLHDALPTSQAQIDDGFNPPDWFPEEHPPMPEIVATGRKPARACALCHLPTGDRSEEHTSELQSRLHLVCRLLLEKKKHTIT